MQMKKIQILGERCSGTNYLEQLLVTNFDVEVCNNFCWKHFFGFNDLSNSDDFLFIGIIRNLTDWINSLYRGRHHLPYDLTENIDAFLNNTFYSVQFNNDKNNFEEMMHDRNLETNERYKNIFELRYIKNKYLIETMPKLVKNYVLIIYDDLCDNFIESMNKLKDCGLKIKDNIEFPLNISYYKGDTNSRFIKKDNEISKKKIMEKLITYKELLFYEKLLFTNLMIEPGNYVNDDNDDNAYSNDNYDADGNDGGENI